jgi:hypothetical protein
MAVTFHPALAHSPGLGRRLAARKRWQVPPSPVERDAAAKEAAKLC